MDIDFGKDNDRTSSSDYGFLIVALLVVSVIAHIVLLYLARNCVFFSVALPSSAQRSSAEVGKMNVSRMNEDPLKVNEEFKGRPLKAPDKEKQEERIERLTGEVGQGVAPDAPSRIDVNFDLPESDSKKLEVSPANLVPKLDIAGLSLNLMDEKLVTKENTIVVNLKPKITYADAKGVFDITATEKPSVHAVGSAGLPIKPFGKDDEPGFVSMPPPPLPDVTLMALPDTGNSGSGSEAGFSALAAVSQSVLSDAEKNRRDAIGNVASQIELPDSDLPPPSTPQVDKKVVAQEKESVRRLRDESKDKAESFSPFVNVDLTYWSDPAKNDVKYFKLRVASRDDKTLPTIPKDVVYLMDVSGSVGRDRVRSCCKAISKSINMLGPQDRFNIVKFAKHFSYAFPERSWQKVSPGSINKAQSWLSSVKAGGNTDVFGTLESILALPRNPARPMIAYVITDGDATSGVIKPAEIITKFSKLNGGLISVYMYGVKDKSNRYLMDMIARGNRGEWVVNDAVFNSHSRAGDKLPSFTEKFNKPLLTDIAIMFTESSGVQAYPKLVSNLYASQSIDIYGTCPANQTKLVFSMRGLNATKAYEHLFEISFDKAEVGNESLKKEWAQRKAHAMVEDYTLKPTKKVRDELISFSNRYEIDVPYKKEIVK